MDFVSILLELWKGVVSIVTAPFKEPSIIWQLAPLIFLWVVLEIYFTMYKKETLGWNTALGNGVSLFWIVISVMQYIFSNNREFFTWTKFIFIVVVLLYGLFIIYISFRHSINEKFAFIISSPSPIYFFSMMTIFVAYDLIAVNLLSIGSMFVTFVLFLLLRALLFLIIPESKKEKEASDMGGFNDANGGGDFSSNSSFGDASSSSSMSDPFSSNPSQGSSSMNDLNSFNQNQGTHTKNDVFGEDMFK